MKTKCCKWTMICLAVVVMVVGLSGLAAAQIPYHELDQDRGASYINAPVTYTIEGYAGRVHAVANRMRQHGYSVIEQPGQEIMGEYKGRPWPGVRVSSTADGGIFIPVSNRAVNRGLCDDQDDQITSLRKYRREYVAASSPRETVRERERERNVVVINNYISENPQQQPVRCPSPPPVQVQAAPLFPLFIPVPIDRADHHHHQVYNPYPHRYMPYSPHYYGGRNHPYGGDYGRPRYPHHGGSHRGVRY